MSKWREVEITAGVDLETSTVTIICTDKGYGDAWRIRLDPNYARRFAEAITAAANTCDAKAQP